MSDESSLDFVRQRVKDDLDAGKNKGKLVTRFPPEPNGYLHIGHAKSICLNFGIAEEFGGIYNLRFDDTNPAAEEVEYVDSIQEDIRWLGFDWKDRLFFASDFYGRLYEFAVELIKKEKAFVCDLSLEEIAERRGDTEKPGTDSPHRQRSVEENLDLFTRMRAGEFADGTKTLRAKIDMSHPNFHMRDPVIYRIKKVRHHRTGDKWPIYPMYDFAHPLSDALEGVTHSIYTLEFEVHRPLYDWLIENLDVPAHPQQIEFARLNIAGVLMSKRYMLRLVNEGKVSGWDDPRMPTLSGHRRRGYTPESIRELCKKVGVSKFNSLTEISLLDHCIREDLNKRAPRYLGVMKPLKVVITNYPEGQEEEFDAVNNPEDESMGKRKLSFSREIYVEATDFMEDPPRKFNRLTIGKEVRLRYAYFITTQEVIKNDKGEVVELRCTYDPESRGGSTPDGRKVRGTIHWVSAAHAVKAEIRLYERLFLSDEPAKELDKDLDEMLNPHSLVVNKEALVEPALKDFKPGVSFQFERTGYFCADPDSKPGAPVFNRTVPLRDSWGKKQQK
ncbi:MAG: glutamine--tRNA ligase [Elusimicrobia bacterium]|nr:MAG: glutamine--tRNA ligase [Elusimicrobiota bacterium]